MTMDRNEGAVYDLPIEIVKTQVAKTRQEMVEVGEVFLSWLDKFENCAKNVRECSLKADRTMFQPFFDAIFRRPCIQILGSKNDQQIYEVTGMDGCGIYLKKIEDDFGKEFYLNVMERSDMAARIRRARMPEPKQTFQNGQRVSLASDVSDASSSPSSSASSEE